MRIGLLTPRPDHPLLAATTALLRPRHEVVCVDPEAIDPMAVDPAAIDPEVVGSESVGGSAVREGVLGGPLADVYLLKARTPRALALARALEARGAAVLNSASATELCQDRTAMAELAHRAGLPFARTRTVSALRHLVTAPAPESASAPEPEPDRPFVVKSRHSRRHDLVARVDHPAQLRALCAMWADEPVVVQPFTPNSGWDHKLWVIAGQVFAALRRSELAVADRGPAVPLQPADLPAGWAELARTVGTVFALDVYGVDILDAGGGAPVIVDINAFPGLRGQSGAPQALADLALRGPGTPRASAAERRQRLP